MIIQNKTLSQMSFELLNAHHPYRRKVTQCAEANKYYDDFCIEEAIEITKLYIDYRGIDYTDVSISKYIVSYILDGSWMEEGNKDIIKELLLSEILEKYRGKISEDIEEEIQYLRSDSMQDHIELSSVNESRYI